MSDQLQALWAGDVLGGPVVGVPRLDLESAEWVGTPRRTGGDVHKDRVLGDLPRSSQVVGEFGRVGLLYVEDEAPLQIHPWLIQEEEQILEHGLVSIRDSLLPPQSLVRRVKQASTPAHPKCDCVDTSKSRWIHPQWSSPQGNTFLRAPGTPGSPHSED